MAGFLSMFAASPLPASSDDTAWREDVRFLAEEISERHADPFTKVDRDAFQEEVDLLLANVPSLTDHQVTLRIMRLLARIGDAHTTLAVESVPGLRAYPLRLERLASGAMVVTRALSEDAVGTRLVAIGGQPVELVASAVAQLIPHENRYWVRARLPRYLVTAEILRGLRLVSETQELIFEFETAEGERFERALDPLSPGETLLFLTQPETTDPDAPLYRRNTNLSYWFEYLPEARALYIAYNRAQEDPVRPLDEFSDELGSVADSNPVDRLVLDLRRNTGGNSALLNQLLADLFERGLVIRPGRSFVLIGPRTFSSGMLNAHDARRDGQAILVGEPTGGKPNSFGEVQTLRLPNSDLPIQYSTRFIQFAEGDPRSLYPDFLIPVTFSDVADGRDPVLERALAPSIRRPANRLHAR